MEIATTLYILILFVITPDMRIAGVAQQFDNLAACQSAGKDVSKQLGSDSLYIKFLCEPKFVKDSPTK